VRLDKINFRVRKYRQTLKGNPRQTFALTTNAWDDYGFKVSFGLSYIDDYGVDAVIGGVKILEQEMSAGDRVSVKETTQLPASFPALGDHFISLGQEDEYYERLFSTFGDDAEKILLALNDIAWQPSLATPLEPTTAFRNALMRANSAHRARRFGRAWALGHKIQETPAFEYHASIHGAVSPVSILAEFDGKDGIPGRIVGIIGKNAVGKTRVLANLAEDLAHLSRASADRFAERETRFPGGRPLYTRVIAVSYSAFDHFRRPEPSAQSSYVYCGIRNDKGTLSRSWLQEVFVKNRKRIRDQNRESDWASCMRMILEDQEGHLTSTYLADNELSAATESLARLSSGQSILSHFVTALLAWIQPHTLVLFDEPATHLHPSAVASLFIVLTRILQTYESYAVVATHSPIVIQEIPAKRVIVLQRNGNLTEANTLRLETFGESISELTRHVFGTIDVDSLYRHTLKELSEDESAAEVVARFEHGLGLNAQAFLLAQYTPRGQ
jgi:energy-coupling factor transporter ATP-binding protein EcfA2